MTTEKVNKARDKAHGGFAVGDRCRVYATLNGAVAESKGAVTRLRPDGMLYVNLDGRRGEIVAHPKQCRKLVKRERRRVWVREQRLLARRPIETFSVALNEPKFPGWIEFIEVRKRGGKVKP